MENHLIVFFWSRRPRIPLAKSIITTSISPWGILSGLERQLASIESINSTNFLMKYSQHIASEHTSATRLWVFFQIYTYWYSKIVSKPQKKIWEWFYTINKAKCRRMSPNAFSAFFPKPKSLSFLSAHYSFWINRTVSHIF